MARIISAVIGTTLLVAVSSAASGTSFAVLQSSAERFAPVPSAFVSQCRSTARAVGYPVPCPMRVPLGFNRDQDGATPGCAITIICPESGDLRGWAAGSTSNETEHLVIKASPHPVGMYSTFINWPSGGSHVRVLGWVRRNDWRLRVVFVRTLGSAFAHHVVLVWTVGQHTYGLGFHDFAGLHRTLSLDEELVKNVRLVRP